MGALLEHDELALPTQNQIQADPPVSMAIA
jgi:hypothetical protein